MFIICFVPNFTAYDKGRTNQKEIFDNILPFNANGITHKREN